jgi:hypothetical protein
MSNHVRKLTPSERTALLALKRMNAYSQSELADQYQISRQRVSQLVKMANQPPRRENLREILRQEAFAKIEALDVMPLLTRKVGIERFAGMATTTTTYVRLWLRSKGITLQPRTPTAGQNPPVPAKPAAQPQRDRSRRSKPREAGSTERR